jgi:RNA polymerase subunit RPABC4/transcription elongation factor Spt4
MPCGNFGSGLAGLWAVGGRMVKRDESDAPTANQQTRCPDCSFGLSEKFSWCPRCGSRLKSFTCDYCQGTVPDNEEECPHCGAPIN